MSNPVDGFERRVGTDGFVSFVKGPPAPARLRAGRWPFWLAVATLVVGMLATGALAWVSHNEYQRNEQRLLKLRVRDAGSLLTEALPAIETPLVSAAVLADATGGNVPKFRRFIAPYAGTRPSDQFVSVSLWRAGAASPSPLVVVGAAPKLASDPAQAQALLGALASRTLHVVGLLREPDPRLGYLYAPAGTPRGLIVYGETRLPTNRRSRFASTSQFAGLDYALYLGATQRPQDLLVTSVAHLPLQGQPAAEAVPFGDTKLTLAMTARSSLAGALPEALPWIIVVGGVLLSGAAALGAWRLIVRRREAEALAGKMELVADENRRLYAEQRSIAQTLQHALLPDRLPQLVGAQTSGCYKAGERGVDIGGDWYDVIDIDEHRLLLVVGDVSGRGLHAATTMAALRFAIRAYAAQGDSPSAILTKLSELLRIDETGQLATILCALLDVERHELSVTSAGHLPPLLITGGDTRYLRSDIGLPVGVESGASYASATISAPRAATLLAFTDGLVEQRGESLEHGLTRLSEAASRDDEPLPELLDRLVAHLPRGPCQDDIAIVGVRWTS